MHGAAATQDVLEHVHLLVADPAYQLKMTCDRRAFLRLAAAAPFVAAGLPGLAQVAAAPQARRLLILVELKGGNDGLNTVIPFADPAYARLRPRLAIAREQVVQLDERTGLHPSLEKLKPAWDARELAVLQGLGYPEPNLSHFRSIEIWDTASRSDEYLDSGWLARALRQSPSPAGFAADGVVVGSGGMGPLGGSGARAIALTSPEQFLRNARLACGEGDSANPALAHILRVERDILVSAQRLHAGLAFATAFPAGAFGNAVGTSAQLAANRAGVAVVRLSLGSFDTHANQAGVHAALLRQLGDGLAALREALVEIGRWDTTLVATYSEFGRRPAENQSGGTDHGTAAPHFVLGGKVKGACTARHLRSPGWTATETCRSPWTSAATTPPCSAAGGEWMPRGCSEAGSSRWNLFKVSSPLAFIDD